MRAREPVGELVEEVLWVWGRVGFLVQLRVGRTYILASFTKVENESTSLSLETGLLLKLRGQLRRFASGFRATPPPSHANGSLSLCFLSSRTQPPPLSQTETVTPGRVSQ